MRGLCSLNTKRKLEDMKHATLCKIRYALCSLPTTLSLKCKGIKISGVVYSGGWIFASRSKDSEISIGRNCRFMNWSMGNLIGLNHRCMISTGNAGAKLTIGNNCSFSGASIWCFDSITLKDNVRIGANVTIMDGDAHQDDPRAGVNAPVVIEENVWVGANTIILKGVTIGRNSLIGAGSVVVKSIPENVIAAGNPCKVIRRLEEEIIDKLEK